MRDMGRYALNAVGGIFVGLVLAMVFRPGAEDASQLTPRAEGVASRVAREDSVVLSGAGTQRTARTVAPDPEPSPRPIATLYERPASPPSIGALSNRVYIRAQPDRESPEIGALALGTAIRLRHREPVSRHRCRRGWYPVEPDGYVCLDDSTTLDVDHHPLMRVKREHHGDFTRAAPFAWGKSLGTAPLYRRLPTEDEQRGSEPALLRHRERVNAARENPAERHRSLIGVDVRPSDSPSPDFLQGQALSPWSLIHTPGDLRARVRDIPRRSTVAWTDEFSAEGRTWVLTEDLLIAPKDRLVRQEPSSFAGVQLGERHQLPIAFIRGRAREQFRFTALDEALPEPPEKAAEYPVYEFLARAAYAGRLVVALSQAEQVLRPSGESWPRLSWVELTGQSRVQRGERYLEVRGGAWIRAKDATLAEKREPRGIEAGEKWLDVSIANGTLVAYEGERPVFATLISPGANGYKRIDGKPAKWTTPRGSFRIEWKHRSTTMSPDPDRMTYYLSEVPYTQFFHMPFALHAAYWHDRFGEPKSGGCVNLSVADARWLFRWTEPRVPAGWHSVRSGGDRGLGTWVQVR